jgi:translocator protein
MQYVLDRKLQCANLATFLISTIISVAPPAVGKSNAEISGMYPTLVTPAGPAFSIWALIYLSEFAFCIYSLLPSTKNNALVKDRVSLLFVLTQLTQLGWSFAFNANSIPTSLAIMTMLFFFLGAIFLRLDCVRARSYFLTDPQPIIPSSLLDYWLVLFPLTVHFGWVTVAWVANINIMAVANAALPSTQIAVAMVSLAAVFAISTYFLRTRLEAIYVGPIVWASFWIARNNSSGNVGYLNLTDIGFAPDVVFAVSSTCFTLGGTLLFFSACAIATKAFLNKIMGKKSPLLSNQ